MKKWMYQTDDGKRFWAEGQYYFNFALMDVLPFWHAIRANNMLGTVSDPFHNSWFLNPVEWLADTSTPDGLTAPINDGNKHTISAAPLLRWNPVYGDATVGGKFQSIYETKAYYRDLSPAPPHQYVYLLPDHTWLLELAIPKATTAIPIEYDISDSDEEQLIIRQRDGQDRLHYVYLNAEGHNNIVRGEGHQQPDNMSLLYYVDDASYLMNTGYDRAKMNRGFPPTWTKSSWNNYTDQNVTMIAQPALGPDFLNPGNPESGMRFPRLELSEKRVVSDHQPVDTKAFLSQGNLSAVFSQTDLKTFDESGSYSPYADYFRFSLFVNDPDRPYLIDMNFGYPLSSAGINQLLQFRTTYHINSNNLLFTPQHDQFALFTDIGQYSDRYLFIKPALVERSPVLSNSTVIQNGTALEFFESIRPEHPIRKLNIYSQGPDENPNGMVSGYTGVAFIEAHSGLSTSDAQNKTFLYNDMMPEHRFEYPTGNNINSHQAWTWQRAEDIVDMLVVRSAFIFNPNTPHSPNISLTMDGFSFDPSVQVTLQAGKAFGFMRFIKESGQWVVEDEFKINLTIPTPPQLSVQVQGVNTMSPFEIQDFTASISNGTPPYSYEWSKQVNNGAWQVISNDPSYTAFSPPTDFALKVSVTDGNNNTAVSDVHQVVVEENHFSKMDNQPDKFSLDGNYPNPFNPITTINFGLPEQANVRIKVYNLVGQRVATLINSSLSAGHHNVQFDASRLASGNYIVQIQAEGVSGEQFNSSRLISLVK